MRILFFGRLREALGDECELADEPDETVAGMRRRLAGLHPHAAADLLSPRVRACVDDAVVGEDFIVSGHGQVELLPPLSGG